MTIGFLINRVALAHLGERQTEVDFSHCHLEVLCSIHRSDNYKSHVAPGQPGATQLDFLHLSPLDISFLDRSSSSTIE